MTQVFADTVYFLALLNASDQWHARARAVSAKPPGPLLTSDFVLMEVGDALSRPGDRPRFAALVQILRRQADVEIVPAGPQLFADACQLHAERPDKDWSLTDCTSFVVMRTHKVESVLTSDHHFVQAGFKALMG
jgi:predicted nucleic acid-binding protein